MHLLRSKHRLFAKFSPPIEQITLTSCVKSVHRLCQSLCPPLREAVDFNAMLYIYIQAYFLALSLVSVWKPQMSSWDPIINPYNAEYISESYNTFVYSTISQHWNGADMDIL